MIRWIGRDGKSSARAGMVGETNSEENKSAANDNADQSRKPLPDLRLVMSVLHLSAYARCHSLARREKRVKTFMRQSFVGDRLDGPGENVLRRRVSIGQKLVDGRPGHRPHIKG